MRLKWMIIILMCLVLLGLSFIPVFAKGTTTPVTTNVVTTPLKIGDYVTFGTYYNSPIVWRVINIDNVGNPLLFADRILTIKSFDAGGSYFTDEDRLESGSNFYANSNLRQWLNSSQSTITWLQNPPNEDNIDYGLNPYDTEKGFLADGNFTQSEREMIKPYSHAVLLSPVDAALRDGGKKDSHTYEELITGAMQNYADVYYKNVTDNVFLLSIKQLKELVYNRGYVVTAKPTPEAVSNSFYWDPYLTENYNWDYWLNTPDGDIDFPDSTRSVDIDGDVTTFFTNSDMVGVRPAVQLNVNELTFVGSKTGTLSDPHQIARDVNKVTLYYKKGYATPYITYKVGNNAWTPSPGTLIPASQVFGYNMIKVNLGTANSMLAAFNNGGTGIDNNSGLNYSFSTGTYTYIPGVSGSSGAILPWSPETETNPPTAPTNLLTTSVKGTTVGLKWTAATDNIYVSEYDIYLNSELFDTIVATSAAGPATTYTVTGLMPGTEYSISVEARDPAGNISASSNELTVTTNYMPTDISLDNFVTAENQPNNTLIGNLTTEDADVNESFVYSLVAGTGDTDNSKFQITGSQLFNKSLLDFEAKEVLSIRVRVTDSAQQTIEKVFSITVTNVNDPPVLNAISDQTTNEDTSKNITLVFSDQDGTVPQITVSGVSNNTVTATVTGTTLTLKPALNYNNAAGLQITVTASDGSAQTSRSFLLKITAVNDAPTDITLSKSTLVENGGANAIVGAMTSADVDSTTFTYSLVAGTGDTDNAKFNISGNSLRATNSLSFVTVSSYSVRIRVSDGALTFTKVFLITKRDITAPTKPGTPVVSQIEGNGFKLTWTASTDNIQVTGYRIYLNNVLSTTINATTHMFTTLTGYTTYSIQVAAFDAEGNESVKSTAISATTLVTPPTVPSGLAISQRTATGALLSWQASSATTTLGLSLYEVFLGNQSLGTTTNLSYTLTGLQGYTSYEVSVRAADTANNWSERSTATSFRTLDVTTPTTPKFLYFTNLTSTSVQLNWYPSTDTGSGVEKYQVYVDGSLYGSTSNLFISITGLKEYTDYQFSVVAVDGENNLSPSTKLKKRNTLDQTPPTIPSGFNVTNITGQSFQLNWQPSSDTGTGVEGYEVLLDDKVIGQTTETSFLVTGLKNITEYTVQIRARDRIFANVSNVSDTLTIKTLDQTQPTTPTGLTVLQVGVNSIRITWNPSADNLAVIAYNIYVDGKYLRSLTGTTTLVTGLLSNTTYSLRVNAYDAASNRSALSSAVTAKTLSVTDVIAPSAPSSLSSVEVSGTSFKLTWSTSTDANGIFTYEVLLNGLVVDKTSSLSYTFKNLTINTSYQVSVRAIDMAGNKSTLSSSINVNTNSTIIDVSSPSIPSGLTVTQLTESGFLLRWSPSTDDVGVKGYNLYRNGAYVTTVNGTTYTFTGLPQQSNHQIRILAYDAAGNRSAQSETLQVSTLPPVDTQAPTSPSELTIVSINSTGVSLKWKVSSDNLRVSDYEVIVDGVLEQKVKMAEVLLSRFQSDTLYKVRVVAVDWAGNKSESSSEIVVKMAPQLDEDAPLRPGNPVSSNIAETSFSLTWGAATDDGIVSYQIEINGVETAASTLTSFEVTGLASDTIYTVRVRAVDGNQNLSDWSEAILVQTSFADLIPPTAPADLKATTVSQTSVTLVWSPATDNRAVAGYEIYQNSVKIGESATTSFSASGLTATTKYTFTVFAVDQKGNRSLTEATLDVTTAAPPDVNAPTTPTGLYLSQLTTTSLRLNWNPSTDNVGVTGYNIYRNGAYVATVTTTSYTLTNLTPDTPYQITALALDLAKNRSAMSAPLSVRTLLVADTIAPTIPSGLQVSNIKTTSLTLSWSASTDGSGVFGYDVSRNGTFLATVRALSFDVTGLVEGSSYTFAVRAIDLAGNRSAYSNGLPVTVIVGVDAAPPTQPTGLNVSNLGISGFRVSWAPATDNTGVSGYNVYRNGAYIATVTSPSYMFTGLVLNTTYSITVLAFDAAKNRSVLSAPLTVKTLAEADVTPPSVPTGLSSSQITQTGVNLTWLTATDNVTVWGYEILQNGTVIGTSASSSYVVSGLSPGTQYSFTVRAIDQSGNKSATSLALSITTTSSSVQDSIAPTVPQGLSATNVTTTGVRVSWTAATDNVAVTGYNLYRNGAYVATVTGTAYTFTTLTAATTYQITVLAYDNAKNRSALSQPLSVTTNP